MPRPQYSPATLVSLWDHLTDFLFSSQGPVPKGKVGRGSEFGLFSELRENPEIGVSCENLGLLAFPALGSEPSAPWKSKQNFPTPPPSCYHPPPLKGLQRALGDKL